MTYPAAGRRLDRVLAPEYLLGLAKRPVEEIRAMRAETEQEETDLSYLRRLLQGRLDILRAEQARRRGEGAAGSLIDALPEILADDRTAPRGSGRHATAEPSALDSHRRYVEALVSDSELSDPSRHDDDTLARLVDVLDREERDVSRKRRSVQAVMDACSAELGRRYREGAANVEDLLPDV
ncbi:MAG TPA: aerial mycelium formation protein [Mycobacteriales bacterium]|nr:aerial mycelium formation protein [Mycobacteriales bacterium]